MSRDFARAQQNQTLLHPTLPQEESAASLPSADYTFVVCADTQFGMTKNNKDWEAEKSYSRQVIQQINALEERPLFCCVCGDLVHMTADIYAKERTEAECHRIQDAQNADFQQIWAALHEDIALVCVCGNHDVGNRPTAQSVDRFRQAFGNDYLAFWVRGTYNIVVNTSLFNDPTGAPDLFAEQFQWLRERLQYARAQKALHIFVFGHHPWFLYQQDEDPDKGDLPGASPFPKECPIEGSMPDSYFVIPLEMRRKVLALFEEYGVRAAFAGHFHQNVVSESKFGMAMITTSSLSIVLKSTGVPHDFDEPNTRGMRIVRVGQDGSFGHRFVSL